MKKGFTLVELVVVITVMLIVAVLGYASLNGYMDKKAINEAAQLVEKELIRGFHEARNSSAAVTVKKDDAVFSTINSSGSNLIQTDFEITFKPPFGEIDDATVPVSTDILDIVIQKASGAGSKRNIEVNKHSGLIRITAP